MTLSNKLTITRIILAFIFMFFLFSNGVAAKAFALVVFIAASCTDFLDGFLAKKRNEITKFGTLMDPIADKILTIAALLAFVEMAIVPAWMVVIIIIRELAVTALRIVSLAKGKIMAASMAGKQKTVTQIVSIVIILIFIIFKEAGTRTFGFWNSGFEYWYRQTIFILMLITVVLTVVSGISYVKRNIE